MLAARALAVVLVADDHPASPTGLEVAGDRGESLRRTAGQGMDALARFPGERVDGAEEHVVAELVEVAPEAEPRTGRRDVIRRRLALGLDEQHQIDEVPAVPPRERRKQL